MQLIMQSKSAFRHLQRLGKRLERAFSYFQFFSPFGLLLSLVIGIGIHSFISLQLRIDQAFILAKLGAYDSWHFDGYFNGLHTMLIIVSLAYILLILPLLIWLRFRWARTLARSVVVQRHQQVRILVNPAPPSNFCLLSATLRLKNLTTNQPLLVAPDPTTLLQNSHLTFNLTLLPTGEYELVDLVFSFQDPLKLFSTKQIVTLNHETAYVHQPLPTKLLSRSQTQKVADRNAVSTQLSLRGDQDWFNTRAYETGDSLRHIHWKKTAQLQQLVVRKTEAEPFIRHRIKAYVNLYAPFFSQTSQSRLIGNYLDSILFELHQLTQMGWQCEVLFNTATTSHPLHLHKENFRQETPTFFQRCRVQDSISLEQFLMKKHATEGILFSLSSDPSVKKFLHLTHFKTHLYVLSQDPFYTIRTLIKATFANPKKYEPYLANIFQHSVKPQLWLTQMKFNKYLRQTEKELDLLRTKK